jgi:hypothetical protein
MTYVIFEIETVPDRIQCKNKTILFKKRSDSNPRTHLVQTSNFTNKETEAQRIYGNCLRSTDVTALNMGKSTPNFWYLGYSS